MAGELPNLVGLAYRDDLRHLHAQIGTALRTNDLGRVCWITAWRFLSDRRRKSQPAGDRDGALHGWCEPTAGVAWGERQHQVQEPEAAPTPTANATRTESPA